MELIIADNPWAKQDLDNLAMVYKDLGCEVTRVSTESKDAMFLRDVGVFTPWGLIQCKMANELRVDEPDEFCHLIQQKPVWKSKFYFEGADLHFLSDTLVMLGLGSRTSETDIGAYLAVKKVRVITVQLPSWHDQHLLGLVNTIQTSKGTTVWTHPELVPMLSEALDRPFVRWNLGHDVTIKELPAEDCVGRKGSNWVQVSNTVVLNREATETARLLEEEGLRVAPVGIEQLLEQGGGVACATCIKSPQANPEALKQQAVFSLGDGLSPRS